jgi:hypothetical protein
LLVVVLEREHALVGPVLVGQELAERVGIFDGGRVERLEAVGLEHAPDRAEHVFARTDFTCGNVGKAFRQAGLGARGLGLLAHCQVSAGYQCPKSDIRNQISGIGYQVS